MYFKRKSNIIFRNYDHFGYITDNRNFGYEKSGDKGDVVGDKIVSQSGTIFLSALGEIPQTLDDIAVKIITQFVDVDVETIKSDAIEFFYHLEQDGFVVSGLTPQECNEKDSGFSYNISKSRGKVIKSPEKITQEFLDEYFKDEPQLTNVHIEISSSCNERCLHCYIPHENKVNNMSADLFYNIIEQCKEMKVLHLTLTGGEPMLHESFVDFLKKCKEYNMSLNILSNLTLLTDEIVEVMKDNHLLGVHVSLYSMDSKIHDAITQVDGSFELTKNSIEKLKHNDVPLQISCPILKQNKNCYIDVLKWAEMQNINVNYDYVIIGKCDSTTQNLKSRLSVEDVREVLNRKISDNTGYLEVMVKEYEDRKNCTPNDIVCSVCHSSICIADDGSVYPCAGWQGYIVGDVKERPLQDIWKNSKEVQYLRGLRKRDMPKCIECDEKDYCTMCMVRNANENPFGDPLIVNQFYCDIAKIKKELLLSQRAPW